MLVNELQVRKWPRVQKANRSGQSGIFTVFAHCLADITFKCWWQRSKVIRVLSLIVRCKSHMRPDEVVLVVSQHGIEVVLMRLRLVKIVRACELLVLEVDLTVGPVP